MSRLSFTAARRPLLAAAVLALAACGESTSPPLPPVTRTVTVDASAAYQYLAFEDTNAVLVTVTDPAASTAWDMSFYATTVTLNGGNAGPADVSAFCLCRNAAATNAELAAMTPENQLPFFDSVGTADIPAAASFVSDQLATAISGWYTGTGAAATVTPSRAWLLREGTTTVTLGKFVVTQIAGATAANPGSVTFQYAVQAAPGGAFGATQTVTVSTAAGPVYFDLATGAVSTSADWDIQFDGWNIRLNSGVSGSGTTRALLDVGTPFANIDAAYTATAPAQAFRADSYSGAFSQNPWYRYNITGTDNQIWPTYNVYLVRRGSAVYRVQLTGYYSSTGAPRNITVRYSRIAG
jgi:hypothetical protein